MIKYLSRSLNIVLVIILLPLLLIAGTTGKIAGKIVDSKTREPIVGANVLLVGTSLGASTDFEGEFYIINIPPGLYNLSFRMVGYVSKNVEEVRVQVDLTTKVDVELEQTTIEMNAVTVTMKRNEVQKDLSSSERTMQKDQIQLLPARDVTSLLSMQAGVTRDAQGDLHIRGGRTSEITYMVDGVQILNPLNRSAGISVDDQSIEELKAITGTFNAEYGQALSGVVNIVTKRGADKFSVNATAFAGDYLSYDKLYSVMDNRQWAEAAARFFAERSPSLIYQILPYGATYENFINDVTPNDSKPWLTKKTYLSDFKPLRNHDLQLNISGPIPGLDISYFLAGRYNHAPNAEKGMRYFMPWGLWQPALDSVHTYEMPDGKLVPLGWYEGYSGQAKIFFNLQNLDVGYSLLYNNDLSYGGGIKYVPDAGRYYYTERFTHIISLTYLFTTSTVLDIKASYYRNNYKSYLYEDWNDYRYIPYASDGSKNGAFYSYVFGTSGAIGGGVNDFAFWGNDVRRERSNTSYSSTTIDLTSQINKYNLMKLGISGRLHDLSNEYYDLQFSDNFRPIIPDRTTPYFTYYSAKPYELAAYIQDKIEFSEIIINVGVRFDYFYSDGRILADPKDPQIYSPFKLTNKYKNYDPNIPDALIDQDTLVRRDVSELLTYWYKKPDPKYQLSPRLGISFPITESGVLHFSYGHFFQNPAFQYLYVNPNFCISGAGAQNLVVNANLNAERTVMYELGLQQKLTEAILVNVTAFYRDIRDWVGTGYPIDTYASGVTYYTYVNKDHAVAKGITLSSSYYEGPFNLNLDYTFMQAQGTSSNPQDEYNNLNSQKGARVKLIDLNWDQTHSFNAVASYNNQGWTASVVGNISTGFPYTPTNPRTESVGSSLQADWPENSLRRPITINFDVHLGKSFTLGSFRLQAMVDVRNLLDTRNARFVYTDTGLPDFTLANYLQANRLFEISDINEYYYRPGNYSGPRSITFGLRISYE